MCTSPVLYSANSCINLGEVKCIKTLANLTKQVTYELFYFFLLNHSRAFPPPAPIWYDCSLSVCSTADLLALPSSSPWKFLSLLFCIKAMLLFLGCIIVSSWFILCIFFFKFWGIISRMQGR